jgi:hypothetical protein
LHENLPPADKLPWTISYVIRKRAQIDSFNEIPSEKRPPDDLIWYGTQRDIDKWFKKVFKSNENPNEFVLNISEDEIE